MLEDDAFVKHILDAIASIEDYTKNLNEENFVNEENKMARDAVIRQFEIIGEATGRLSENILENNS